MTGQPMEYNRILQTWSICFLITLLGQTVGILVGTAVDVQSGVFLVPTISIPLFLFAGFYVKLEEIPTHLQPLCYISFFRFAFEGLMQAIYLDRANLSCSEIYCHWRSPNKILAEMDMPSMPFYVNLIVLGFWILSLHIITYALLYWKIHYARK
ncbi:PREDICTED: ATP-binding cassette sub-family G member 4-like [Wasmannia auropunctata]|uniref:ATP-binding cassette sub-family G member 4-like n=1 Tax=Wasmannia auropunctata TaxID=64793 RepID=UPI0005EFAC67|nr:PREDICTED: ATP-binding cassette sub-family G member 4-like [Wasmannia auropunctata]